SLERTVQAGLEIDELAEPDGDRVRRPRRIVILVRQLEPRDHEQVVEQPRAGCLDLDRLEVPAVRAGRDLPLRPRHALRQRKEVVGEAEDVEAVAAVEVDEPANGKEAVAPAGVCVELTEQRVVLTLSHGPTFDKVPATPGKR